MAENLLKKTDFYYHPFTREQIKPHRVVVWPDGEVTDVKDEIELKFKGSLSPEDLVDYYYRATKIHHGLQKPQRDIGAVKHLVNQHGLDIVLFAIDALVDDYWDSEKRPANPPELITANDYTQEAYDRLGRTKLVAQQYGIDEQSITH